MLLSVHAIDGSDSAPTAGDWSIGPGLDLRQLGAGVDAQFGECIVDMVSHGMEGKVQLLAAPEPQGHLRIRYHGNA
jgi:hypothetical protein